MKTQITLLALLAMLTHAYGSAQAPVSPGERVRITSGEADSFLSVAQAPAHELARIGIGLRHELVHVPAGPVDHV